MQEKWQGAAWRKSTHSPDTDQCVELATTAGVIGIRDSKDPGGAVLEFSRHELSNLLDRVRAGALGTIVSA